MVSYRLDAHDATADQRNLTSETAPTFDIRPDTYHSVYFLVALSSSGGSGGYVSHSEPFFYIYIFNYKSTLTTPEPFRASALPNFIPLQRLETLQLRHSPNIASNTSAFDDSTSFISELFAAGWYLALEFLKGFLLVGVVFLILGAGGCILFLLGGGFHEACRACMAYRKRKDEEAAHELAEQGSDDGEREDKQGTNREGSKSSLDKM